MIDIENELFSRIAHVVREKYPDAYVTGEYLKSPSSFPCVSFMEIDNQVYQGTRSTDSMENHALITYELNVYSNRTSGKKAECKAIIALMDSLLADIGFTRTMMNPIPNMGDMTIYRITARYRAIVSKDRMLFRS